MHKATRKTHQPRKQDCKLAKKIARYLSGSKKTKLEMRAGTDGQYAVTLESYSDADFAVDKDDRKSLTGAMVLFNGMPVSWSAKK